MSNKISYSISQYSLNNLSYQRWVENGILRVFYFIYLIFTCQNNKKVLILKQCILLIAILYKILEYRVSFFDTELYHIKWTRNLKGIVFFKTPQFNAMKLIDKQNSLHKKVTFIDKNILRNWIYNNNTIVIFLICIIWKLIFVEK